MAEIPSTRTASEAPVSETHALYATSPDAAAHPPARRTVHNATSTTMPNGNLVNLLEQAASRHGQRPFLHDLTRGACLDFATTRDRVHATARALYRSGIRRGDRLAVIASNCLEIPILLFAAARLGAIFTLLGEDLAASTRATILERVEPRLVLNGESLSQTLNGAEWPSENPQPPPSPPLDVDPAALIFTSGSTGAPRGVVLTHDQMLFAVERIHRRLQYRADDRVGLFLPLSFDYGMYQILLAARSGCRLVIGRPDQVGPQWLPLMKRHGVTVLPCVPTMISALVKLSCRGDRRLDLPALRTLTSTGETLPVPLIRQLGTLLPNAAIFPMYGLTECKRVSILTPSEAAARPTSVGRPLDGTEVTIVDDEGRPLAAGEIGEIRVRGRHVAPGYWRDPEATAARFQRDPRDGSWQLLTGDYGQVDAAGYLYVHGRQDGQLKHKGYRIGAAEIEAAVLALPGLTAAAVTRAPNADVLHLFVIGHEIPDDRALIHHLRQRLESYKIPGRIHRLESLPKTANGKIDRRALAGLAALEDGP